MSQSSFETLNRATIVKGIGDSIINDNELWAGLERNNRIMYNKGGNGGEFDVRVLRANIGGVTTDDDMNQGFQINPYRTCTFQYRPYLWRLFQNMLKMDRAQYTPDGQKSADMEENELNTIKQEAQERFGTHSYEDGATLSTGDATGATPMEGFDSLSDSSGTYFGLSRSTYSALQGQEDTLVNPSLTDNPDLGNNLLVGLEDLYLDLSSGVSNKAGSSISNTLAKGKAEPDFFIMEPSKMRILRLSLNQQNQYVDDKQNPRKKLAYGNAIVTWDSFCKANRLFAGRWDALELWVVGPSVMRQMGQVFTSAPVGNLTVLGGQVQMFSREPRKLGKRVISGT